MHNRALYRPWSRLLSLLLRLGPGFGLAGREHWSRLAVPFSAGVLLGVALFGLFPEMAAELGWTASLLLFVSGYGLLFLINRYGYPLCPSCSHDHDHKACTTVLHGFAAPLLSATAVHAFMDGWSITSAQSVAPVAIRITVPLAVGLHKIPEGLALGAILWASMRSRRAALAWCLAAESCTVLGGGLALALASRLGAVWILYPLAVAGGCSSPWISRRARRVEA